MEALYTPSEIPEEMPHEIYSLQAHSPIWAENCSLRSAAIHKPPGCSYRMGLLYPLLQAEKDSQPDETQEEQLRSSFLRCWIACGRPSRYGSLGGTKGAKVKTTSCNGWEDLRDFLWVHAALEDQAREHLLAAHFMACKEIKFNCSHSKALAKHSHPSAQTNTSAQHCKMQAILIRQVSFQAWSTSVCKADQKKITKW